MQKKNQEQYKIEALELTKDDERRLKEIIEYYLSSHYDTVELLGLYITLRKFGPNQMIQRIHWFEFCLNILPKIIYFKEGKKAISVYTSMLGFALSDSANTNIISVVYSNFLKKRKEKYAES